MAAVLHGAHMTEPRPAADATRPHLVSALMKERNHAACWQPRGSGGFFQARPGRTRVLPPTWIIDDGNLLIALLGPNNLPPEAGEASAREAARMVDKTGRILNGAIVDSGMHRLLVLVVQVAPNSGAWDLGAHSESRGDFRVLTTESDPSAEASATFALQLRPLEAEEVFLERVPEARDADVAAQVLQDSSNTPALDGLKAALAGDVRRQLTSDSLADPVWERSLEALRSLADHDHAAVVNGDEEARDG